MKIKKVLLLFSYWLLAQIVVCAQPLPPGVGGGGGTNGGVIVPFEPPPYVPGLKLTAPTIAGTNLSLDLLEADIAGRYDIYFASNVVSDFWSNVLQGVTGQTNFTLPKPETEQGFFRAARSDPAIADAGNLSVYLLHEFVNTNIIATVIQGGGPAAATAILVDSTNFTDATWIPFTSTPLLDIGSTNEGEHIIWIGFRGTNRIEYWSSHVVTLDTMPPMTVLTNPVASVTFKPVVQIQGYSIEPLSKIYFDVTNSVHVSKNARGFVTDHYFDTNSFKNTTNYFQCFDVKLAIGTNVIAIRAADLAGNVTTTNITLVLDLVGDTNPPVVTILWPPSNAEIGGDKFTLRGHLDDETARVSAQIVDSGGTTNFASGLVERNGMFWIEYLPLSVGENTVSLTLTDAAGNTATTNFTVVKSSVELTIAPVGDSALNQSSTQVEGTISDASYEVWINGVQAQVGGDGHWVATNTPVYGNGTATFDAIAYPSGESQAKLKAAFKRNGAGGGSPVAQSVTQEQPMIIYISEYHDQWNEMDGGAHWENTKNYQAEVDSDGHFSYHGFASSNGDLDPVIEDFWWILTYSWSSADPTGFFTEIVDEEGIIESSSGPGYHPITLDYIPDVATIPSVSWATWGADIIHFATKINYEWPSVFGGAHTYSRTSETQMKIRTGGKSSMSQTSFFKFNVGATEYGKPDDINWGNSPDYWFNTPAQNIDPTRIQIMGTSLENDGSVFIQLPDNATIDLTASAAAQHYNLNISTTKYPPHFSTNVTCGAVLDKGEITNKNLCVEQGETIPYPTVVRDPVISDGLITITKSWDCVTNVELVSSTPITYEITALGYEPWLDTATVGNFTPECQVAGLSSDPLCPTIFISYGTVNVRVAGTNCVTSNFQFADTNHWKISTIDFGELNGGGGGFYQYQGFQVNYAAYVTVHCEQGCSQSVEAGTRIFHIDEDENTVEVHKVGEAGIEVSLPASLAEALGSLLGSVIGDQIALYGTDSTTAQNIAYTALNRRPTSPSDGDWKDGQSPCCN